MAGLDAGAPRFKNGRDMVGGPFELEGTAGEDYEDHGFAGGYDGFQ